MSTRITVHVIPNAHADAVERHEGNVYRVHLAVPATQGKANKRLIEVLAEYFGVSKSLVVVEKGVASRIKRVDIG